MDPQAIHELTEDEDDNSIAEDQIPGVRGMETAERPETFVLFERGAVEQRVVHDEERVEQRKEEREREALAQAYARYAQSTDEPVSFEQYLQIMQSLHE